MADEGRLRERDRLLIAEAYHLADYIGDRLWAGWREVPFAVLLVTPEYDFLIRHPRPTPEFQSLGYDSLLGSEVLVRPHDANLSLKFEAAFPAVGGLNTVVIGQPEQTGKSPALWVITALHEHFHQLQTAQPDHFAALETLDLAGGDQTGMWQLNYPFPYQDPAVKARFGTYLAALRTALQADSDPVTEKKTGDFLVARAALVETLDPPDYRYFSMQLWQEGVARYTEYRVGEMAAEADYQPLPAFAALAGFLPYAEVVKGQRQALKQELDSLDIGSWQRVVFYPVGACEALLLDRHQPGWRQHYFTDRFYLENYFTKN